MNRDLKRLLPYIRPYLPLLVMALALLSLSGILEMLIVVLLAPILNGLVEAVGVQSAGDTKFDFLVDLLGLGGADRFPRIALFLVLFSLLKGIFLYSSEYLMSFSGQRVVATLRKRLYDHLLDQSLLFFSQNPTGKLMARVITDTERLQETVSRTLTDFFRQLILLIVFLGVVFYTDWLLALLSFLVAPVVLGIVVKLGRSIRRMSLHSQENLSDISHSLQETISGQKIVKAFGMEGYERGRFYQLVDHLVGVNLKVARTSALGSPLMEFIGYISFVPFLLYAHYQMGEGFTVGAFVVFIAALFKLYEPVRKLSRMHLYFEQASASARRVFELLDEPIRVRDRPGARVLKPFSSSIRFESISFSYALSQAEPVLKGIDLEVPQGAMVALVGRSGAGKTTLVSLLPRFYDVTEGRILIDGVDIRDVTLESLRRQIALVTQETFLFNDTVRRNLAYGQDDCDQSEVVEAAKAAFIHDFIITLPRGYDTIIGERGQKLSGGQRQRLAIARAVLKQAPILILDEATSSLDSESERLVQRALQNLMRERTTLVIAHRLSTVRRADHIVVLREGRIYEQGTHRRLMERSGEYRRLYELQFIDQPGHVDDVADLFPKVSRVKDV